MLEMRDNCPIGELAKPFALHKFYLELEASKCLKQLKRRGVSFAFYIRFIAIARSFEPKASRALMTLSLSLSDLFWLNLYCA